MHAAVCRRLQLLLELKHQELPYKVQLYCPTIKFLKLLQEERGGEQNPEGSGCDENHPVVIQHHSGTAGGPAARSSAPSKTPFLSSVKLVGNSNLEQKLFLKKKQKSYCNKRVYFVL